MALFPNDAALPGAALTAPERMRWTRERGTRNLLIAFISLLLVWYVYGKITDHFLLSKSWPALTARDNGLTVVGTLDSRTSYDRNMFMVVQSNKSSHVSLSDFGWRSIFNGDNDLLSDRAGDAVRKAIQVDDETGYAMIVPYLRYGVARLMGTPHPERLVNADYPITVITRTREGAIASSRETTLGALIDKYTAAGPADAGEQSDSSDEGGGGGRDVDHGLAIPGDTLEHSCPVVLTGDQFTGGWIDEHPANLLQGKTYTVHLNLTPEGRSRFFQWSHDHAGESICFILNGVVQTAGRVRETLDTNEYEIGPLQDGAAANKLVDFVNQHHA